ncbi:MAG: FKBP-type peptidyl-prolyl cis-trans isomerase [Solirubrobacterales bacterium]|nr:FKBP-type peptidyl-prolyl cis-trans isomerase [Solirubrobacterales bacterium]MBV9942514.1 FKBP-type peptidyl-prolyl cis-trans isomerase [Solirubrobacterales bacterium]
MPFIAVVAAGLAGCGSSSKATGVETAPSGGATATTVPTTPKPPPAIAKKPVVNIPKGPAPNSLVTKDLVVGTGATAKAGDTVTVNYVGQLFKNGKEFDSSWSRNQPASFPLTNGGVIAGWVQGIPGMKVGGRRELIIPAKLAYGARGNPPTIPPNSPLVFVVDLLSTSSSS